MFIVDLRDKMPETFNFYLAPDSHHGYRFVATEKEKKFIKMVAADKKGFWAHPGDMTEATFVNHPYYNPYVHEGKAATANAEVAGFVDIYAPIAKKCLAVGDGNHEERWSKIVDISMMIAKGLSERGGCKEVIPFGGRTCKLLFSDTLKFFITHGRGVLNLKAGDPEQREINEGINIKRKLREMPRHDCVVNLMAHVHKARVSKARQRLAVVGEKKLRQIYPSIVRDQDGYIPEEFCWFGSTGALLQGYPAKLWEPQKRDADEKELVKSRTATSYVEKRMYPVVEIAAIKVIVKKGIVVDIEKITL